MHWEAGKEAVGDTLADLGAPGSLGNEDDHALSLSVKLQPNYCLLRGTVKHNQSESLKDTISLFTNCLLVNSKSPPCFKSTNHRAVMNSN